MIGKNIAQFAGRPLAAWVLSALTQAESIDRIVVSVDRPFVHTVSAITEMLDSDKVEMHVRSIKNARDTSYTEDALLEWVDSEYSAPESSSDRLMLTQVTNPFLTIQDIDSAVEQYECGSASSILSCSVIDRFLWQHNIDGSVLSLNYNHYERRRTQDWQSGGYLLENGSFYLSQIGHIWRAKNRLAGRVEPYVMPAYTAQEIDTELDFHIAELIFKEYHLGG
jgi:CMP-N-acetylneuraminic acid synthetase